MVTYFWLLILTITNQRHLALAAAEGARHVFEEDAEHADDALGHEEGNERCKHDDPSPSAVRGYYHQVLGGRFRGCRSGDVPLAGHRTNDELFRFFHAGAIIVTFFDGVWV